MTTWGADAQQLEAAAAALAAGASLIDANRTELDGRIRHAAWQGHAADQFRRQWASTWLPSLASTGAFLRDAELMLRRNAAEQRQASGGAAGPTGPAGPASNSHGSPHRNIFGFVHSQIAHDVGGFVIGEGLHKAASLAKGVKATVFETAGKVINVAQLGKDAYAIDHSAREFVRHPGWSTARNLDDKFERSLDDAISIRFGKIGLGLTMGLDAVESKLGQEEIVSTLDNGVANFYGWKGSVESLLGNHATAADAQHMSGYWRGDAVADRHGASVVNDFN